MTKLSPCPEQNIFRAAGALLLSLATRSTIAQVVPPVFDMASRSRFALSHEWQTRSWQLRRLDGLRSYDRRIHGIVAHPRF
jgi:hypothetical protein